MHDERDELLEEIERLARAGDPGDCACTADDYMWKIVQMFTKARTYGLIRYPVPS